MRLRHLARSAPVAAMIAAVAVAVSGCGASNTIDPVARAATLSTSAPGFRMNMTMTITSPQLPSALTGTGTGVVASHDHMASMSLAMSLGALGNNPQVRQQLGGSTLRMQEVLDHLTLYMKLPSALTSKLPGGKPWLKMDLAKVAASEGMPGLSSLTNNPAGSDPSQMLGYLRASSGHFRNLGTANVDGFQTTHYSASIDLDKVAARFPASQRQAIQQTITTLKDRTGLTTMPVDVWIDQHHMVRRMRMNFGENIPNVGPMHFGMQMDLVDYGPQPQPSLPPASQVTDITSQAASAAAAGG